MGAPVLKTGAGGLALSLWGFVVLLKVTYLKLQANKDTRKNRNRKGFFQNRAKAITVNASTHYETCTEQLSPFGGLLVLIKFFDQMAAALERGGRVEIRGLCSFM